MREVICACEGNYAATDEDEEDHHCLSSEDARHLDFQRGDLAFGADAAKCESQSERCTKSVAQESYGRMLINGS